MSSESPLRLLVVDDDVADRLAVRRAIGLSALAADIVEVSTLEGAYEELIQGIHDCLVLDYHLPDGTGSDLLSRIKNDQCHIATVILTGSGDEDTGIRALQDGADDYLFKDQLDPILLRRSIRYAIERHRSRRALEEVTRKLVETNLALEEANTKLEHLSLADNLTGIPNQRAFQQRVAQLIAEAKRGRRFSVVIGDIDYFKRVNDSFGHRVGDELLVAVARTLSSTVRETDYVARYGGEEFGILLVDVDEALAWLLAERLRDKIASLPAPNPGFDGSVTMSFGVCHYGPDLSTEDALFRAADEALYHAKNSGRNRIERFSDIPRASLRGDAR